MNILIITPFYKQDKNIASVRWTKLAPRLAKTHNVFVVTQPLNDMDECISHEIDDNVNIIRANQKSWYEKLAVKFFGGATGDDWQTKDSKQESSPIKDSLKRRIKNNLIYCSFKIKAITYVKWIVKNIIPKDKEIDIVLSSACPFIEMLFGYELKKKLKCKWVCEFRDLPFVDDNCDATHIEKRIMERILPEADAIITIAPMGKKFLTSFFKIDNEKIQVITNGYSTNDSIKSEIQDDNILHLVHTGNIYIGRRCDLLFKAIKLVLEKRPDCKILVECAGGNSYIVLECAKKYQLEELVDDKGFISRKDALKLQANADCLLIFAYTKPGTLTAKIYEYMLWHKPVICINSANTIECDEGNFVRDFNMGISVSEAKGRDDVEDLANYLIMQYDHKLEFHKVSYNGIEEEIQKFNHDNICLKFNNLFNDLIY